MTPLATTVEVHGSAETRAELDVLAFRLGGGLGPDGAGPAIVQELGDIGEERFSSNGFGMWPQLSPATVQRRRFGVGYYRSAAAAGVSPDGPALVWSGRLRTSVTDPLGAGVQDAVVVMQPHQLEVGTRVPYANLHVPDRNPLELRAEDERRLEAVYLMFLEEPGEE